MNVIEDIKTSKTYILGVLAFATAVAGFLTQVWHFAPEPTILIVAGFTLLILYLGFLINRSEKRQSLALKQHEDLSQGQVAQILGSLERLENGSIENQRSLIRIEMNQFIETEPQNHDTILAYAERYFLELKGDWKQTDKFLQWIDKENEAGRKVYVPTELLTNVNNKYKGEHK